MLHWYFVKDFLWALLLLPDWRSIIHSWKCFETFALPLRFCYRGNLSSCWAYFLTLTKAHLDIIIPVKKILFCWSWTSISCSCYNLWNNSPTVWFHVYTVGSAKDAIRNTGTIAFSAVFEVEEHVGTWSDNFGLRIKGCRTGSSSYSKSTLTKDCIFCRFTGHHSCSEQL